MQCLQIDKLSILFLSSSACSRLMFWISRESDNREMGSVGHLPRNRCTFILIRKSGFLMVMAYSVSIQFQRQDLFLIFFIKFHQEVLIQWCWWFCNPEVNSLNGPGKVLRTKELNSIFVNIKLDYNSHGSHPCTSLLPTAKSLQDLFYIIFSRKFVCGQ